MSQEEDDGVRAGPAPARQEELDEPSGPVEHEPTSRPHGQAATALFDVEDEEEEKPEEVPADAEEPPPDHGHPEGDWELEYSDFVCRCAITSRPQCCKVFSKLSST